MFEKSKEKEMEHASDASFLQILFHDAVTVVHSLAGITDMLGMHLQQYHELGVVACKYEYVLHRKAVQTQAVAAFQF